MIGDLLAGKPINQHDALGVARDVFVEWGGMASEYRPPINGHGQTAHGKAAPFVPFGGWPRGWGPPSPFGGNQQHPPPVDPQEQAQREAIRLARAAMGYTAAERLTEESIKDRRKLLARRHHPDRGGSVQLMSTINNAADVLLASLSQ
jgi:hypothetical protein